MPCGINEYVQILILGVRTAKRNENKTKIVKVKLGFLLVLYFKRNTYTLQINKEMVHVFYFPIHNYMLLKPEINIKICIWETNSASEIQVNIFRIDEVCFRVKLIHYLQGSGVSWPLSAPPVVSLSGSHD